MLNHNLFDSRKALDRALAREILSTIDRVAQKKGQARILFSGGSTPRGLLLTLAEADFDWSKVKIALVDDRVVPQSHEKSNIRFLQENFLAQLKSSFSFYPWVIQANDPARNLEIAQVSLRAFGHADLAILGMGTDGHFASLFPDDEYSAEGLRLDNEINLLYTRSPVEPKKRISLSWAYLRRVSSLFLHITGEEKRVLIESKITRKGLPISHLIEDQKKEVELYWAP